MSNRSLLCVAALRRDVHEIGQTCGGRKMITSLLGHIAIQLLWNAILVIALGLVFALSMFIAPFMGWDKAVVTVPGARPGAMSWMRRIVFWTLVGAATFLLVASAAPANLRFEPWLVKFGLGAVGVVLAACAILVRRSRRS